MLSVVNREQTMAAFERIAAHCKHRGYLRRVPILRKHWLAAKQGAPLGAFAQQLLEGFQLPPFEHALEVRSETAGCPSCGVQTDLQAAPRTVMILEDRGRFVCTGCRREWLCPLPL